MQTKHLQHKHGGRILEVHAVGHKTDEHKVPYWYLRCTVEWDDGKAPLNSAAEPKAKGRIKVHEIMPDRLAYDSSNAAAHVEASTVLNALNGYLRRSGKWLKKGKWVGDYLVHWVPQQPSGEQAL